MPTASQTANQLTKLTINARTNRVNLSIGQFVNWSKGFTLIELLTVIAIIGVLATIGIASFSNAQQKGRDSRRKTDLDTLKKTLELMKQDTAGQYYYPACDSGANCNLTDTNTSTDLAPTYIKSVPKDPRSATGYLYTPSGCTGTNCTSYTLIACLENGNDPQGVTDASNCPTAPQKAYIITPN